MGFADTIQRFLKPCLWTINGVLITVALSGERLFDAPPSVYIVFWIILCFFGLFALDKWKSIFVTREVNSTRRYLKDRGYYAHLYSPAVHVENRRLARFMDYMAMRGYVILDKEHHVVGRLLPRAEKRPHLALVATEEDTQRQNLPSN